MLQSDPSGHPLGGFHAVLASRALWSSFALAAPSSAQFENVGTISFPTSGSPQAQQHFLRGVAILHSFGWKQAIAEFKLAQKAQPDFAMAYWGETLCYNHPLHGGAGREEPARGAGAPRIRTPRRASRRRRRRARRDSSRRSRTLWGEGDWRKRRVAYMNAMERLYKQFPADDEVKTFYALSLLSGARALDDNTFRYEVKAGALALDVFQRNPKHPGAPHYTIHSFDDPVHAPLSLDAAHAYAAIVPAVSHGVHMPTHIFIQHGMWNEVSSQNMRAFQVAEGSLAAGRRARRHGALARLGPVRVPPAGRLRERAQGDRAVRPDGRDDQAPARERRRRAVEGPLHHRDRGVEGAAGRGGRVERDAAGQRDERGEDRRPGDRGEDGGAAGRQGAGRAGRRRGGGRARRARSGAGSGARPAGRRQGRARHASRAVGASSPMRRARRIRPSRC